MLDDIRKSRQGDGQAYRRLIDQHQAAVSRLLWRFTRDRTEHEELVQEVFVQAYVSLASYAGKAPLEHWLARIAVRVGYTYWRKRRRRPAPLAEEDWRQLAAPQPPDHQQAAEIVHRLLERLKPNDRLVLTLRYIEQCDIAETAYRTGWTQTRVRVQTHRAIAKLKHLTRNTPIEVDW